MVVVVVGLTATTPHIRTQSATHEEQVSLYS